MKQNLQNHHLSWILIVIQKIKWVEWYQQHGRVGSYPLPSLYNQSNIHNLIRCLCPTHKTKGEFYTSTHSTPLYLRWSRQKLTKKRQSQGNSRVGACNPGLLTMAAKSTSSEGPTAERKVYLQMKAMSWSHACLSSLRDRVPGPIVTVTQLPMAAGTAVVRRPVLRHLQWWSPQTLQHQDTVEAPARPQLTEPLHAHHHSRKTCNSGSQMLGKVHHPGDSSGSGRSKAVRTAEPQEQ